MRDEKRITPVLQAIETMWRKYPDLRFGQLIYMLSDRLNGLNGDIFFPEDDQWLAAAEYYVNRQDKE